MKRTTLKSLEKLREERRDVASRELAGSVRQREQAESLHQQAKVRREERAQRDARERADELLRAQNNQARVADFQHAGAYAFGVKKELDQLGRQEMHAHKQVHDARLQEQQSRATLVHRDAEAKVVTRQREAIEAEQAAKRELAAEDEALEVHNARRPNS